MLRLDNIYLTIKNCHVPEGTYVRSYNACERTHRCRRTHSPLSAYAHVAATSSVPFSRTVVILVDPRGIDGDRWGCLKAPIPSVQCSAVESASVSLQCSAVLWRAPPSVRLASPGIERVGVVSTPHPYAEVCAGVGCVVRTWAHAKSRRLWDSRDGNFERIHSFIHTRNALQRSFFLSRSLPIHSLIRGMCCNVLSFPSPPRSVFAFGGGTAAAFQLEGLPTRHPGTEKCHRS